MWRNEGKEDQSSNSSSISTVEIEQFVEQLKTRRHHDSTAHNYYGIWKNFNNFVIKLDIKPTNWEDRVVLYVAYLIQNDRKSTTIKSYVSAIKAVLFNGGIKLKQDAALLSSLTRACKINNDVIRAKLLICKPLVQLLINALKNKFDQQSYLSRMYQALIIATYYGMFRIGELTLSQHMLKARDVHIAINKPKLLFVLHSSKTHGRGDMPQMIKITGLSFCPNNQCCPFVLLKKLFVEQEEVQIRWRTIFYFPGWLSGNPGALQKTFKKFDSPQQAQSTTLWSPWYESRML